MSLSIPSPGAGKQNKSNRIAETSNRLNLSFSRKLIVLISIIAIGAIALAVYAFDQKKEAARQMALAHQKTMEALQQQKYALEQRINADTSQEQALLRREQALESDRQALRQKEIAEAEAMQAEQNRLEVLEKNVQLEKVKLDAENDKKLAQEKEQQAEQLKDSVRIKIKQVEDQTAKSNELQQLTYSREMAQESILLYNENSFDSSKSKALEAFLLNKSHNGPSQNNDIYKALHINWTRSVHFENQFLLHPQPVRCITGISNIIFTSDDNGLIIQSQIRNNCLYKTGSYTMEGSVRSLAVSPDRKWLVAITSSGTGSIFDISASGSSLLLTFKFSGVGKSLVFTSNENLLLLSSDGIGQYQLTSSLTLQSFMPLKGVTDMIVNKNGECYIALNNTIKIYKDWNDLTKGIEAGIQRFESQVSCISIDENEQYIAAGTNNGFVWINKLKGDNAAHWYRALHLSVVRDVAFTTLEDGRVQLASAGADQLIKLIDVKAALRLNNSEDIVTLNGHSKWIWKLYYTADGKLLLSAGEDKKVITWKPSMKALYQTLLNK